MTQRDPFDTLAGRADACRRRLSAFLRDVPAEEWGWRPEDGAPSPQEIAAALLAEESSLAERFAATIGLDARVARPHRDEDPCATPASAARALGAARAASLALFRAAPESARAEAADLLARLAFADGAAFGQTAVLLRLIDPRRATPALT